MRKRVGRGRALDKSDSFVQFVKDQMAGLRALEIKRMFGGYGFYLDNIFFGILAGGKLYFKTSDETLEPYLAAGSVPFTYFKKDSKGKNKKICLRRYYELPLDVLENQTRLSHWAKQAAK